MDDLEQLMRLGVALATGLLVGVERGWRERETEEGGRVAGVRTYGLIGLLGGVVGIVGIHSQQAIVQTAFVAITAVMIAAYVISSRGENDVGITSLVAALLTFGFGVLSALGHLAIAAAGAVVTTLILGVKPTIHGWLHRLTGPELKAIIKLLLISVVLLPVLPNEGYGPWEALNPYTIWWMVVLVASISFSGYVAMKAVGEKKGAALTGLFGGLASSTALTLHFSRLARREKLATSLLGFAVLIACGTMFPRVLLIAAAVNRKLLPDLLLPMILMSVIVYLPSALLWRRSDGRGKRREPPTVQNPLDLKMAVRFGALLAVVMLAAEALERTMGEAGLLALAGVSGLSDVDAITLSLSKMSTRKLSHDTAVTGIVIAAASNTVVKGALSGAVGGMALGRKVLPPLVLATLAGIVWVWLV